MLTLVSGTIFSLLVWPSDPARAGPDPPCREQQEHWSGTHCCQNCPAGTYVSAACTAAGQRGACRECEDGTFMEHTNGLTQCFSCTPCRSDQEVVTPCTHTLNTVCRCGPGRFCDPNQACELCKKCSRCGPDEEAVRNCTPTANTKCKKVPSTSAPPAVDPALIGLLSLLAIILVIAAAAGWYVWKRRGGRGTRSSPAERKPGEDLHAGGVDGGARGQRWSGFVGPMVRSFRHTEEECKALQDSCASSASNSQYSLTGLPPCPSPAPPPIASPAAPPRPPSREEEPFKEVEPFPRLVPVGEESLRRCFEYFEELDLDYHNRFFRRLSISDNVVKSKEELPYEDRLHQLLDTWMEKEGRGASLDQLLQVLLDLDQRRTADNIRDKAVEHGHYRCEG